MCSSTVRRPTRLMASDTALGPDSRQRRQARRMAIVLGLVAVAVYVAYILFALRHGHP